ncbi:MAG TPA: hypothetical protein VK470_03795 [Bacteroidota bacterium]|nr:hypothetical protein [Bacteroidota bacterium]
MKNTLRRDSLFLGLILLLALLPASLRAQTAKATSVFGYPGAGVISAGDIWESMHPQNSDVPFSSEASTAATLGQRVMVRMGNFERSWSTPNSNWPNAYPIIGYWNKELLGYVFDTSSTFNPEKIGGAANPSYFSGDKADAGAFSNYAGLTYKPTVVGAGDPTRNYSIEPYWTDARRQHAVYEAGWPTNTGIDVKVRMHGFASPNWGNLNDFALVEVTFKNTGVVDMNMDGVAEKTNNKIPAFAFWTGSQSILSTSVYRSGLRGGGASYTMTPIGRQTAYIADPDATGAPWNMVVLYPSATTERPAPGSGKTDLGFNNWGEKNYTDIWCGWSTIDVKKGAMPADVNKSVSDLESKQTIFGTHPIGLGAQRGWYTGAMASKLGSNTSSPRDMFLTCVGEWFKDGGRTIPAARTALDLNPNPNFFASGTRDNILTFVPKANPGMPDGDSKSAGKFDQASFEDGSADAATKYPTGYGVFSKGATHTENFDGEMFQSVGPFSLDVGESITVVVAMVAGFRLEGIQRATEAARWAFDQNLNIPKTPSLPKLVVKNTLNKSTTLEWDKAAESDAQFAGYKIYRSSQYLKKSYLDEGMRVVDRYQENMTPGPVSADLKKPVNPKFDAFAAVNATSLKGKYQPDTWGTWDLIKVIPKADLAGFTATSNPGLSTSTGYTYKYEDKDVVLGFSYWYYISAYKEGAYAGPGGQTTNRIETHSTNRNGASGLWNLTYPFAFANANFPSSTNAAAYTAMGAVQIVNSALSPKDVVANVGVRPNPYKRAALHDNFSNVYDHKLLFYNLPSPCKITIADVAGQIIDVINFQSANQNVGSTFWDMFSKDGIEVASGLYIYIVESGVQKKVGHFAILR